MAHLNELPNSRSLGPPPAPQATSCLHWPQVVLPTPVPSPRSFEAALASPKPVPFSSKEYCSPGREWVPHPNMHARPQQTDSHQAPCLGAGEASVQGTPTPPVLPPAITTPKEAPEDEQSSSPSAPTASRRGCSTRSMIKPEQPQPRSNESQIPQQKPESGVQAVPHR